MHIGKFINVVKNEIVNYSEDPLDCRSVFIFIVGNFFSSNSIPNDKMHQNNRIRGDLEIKDRGIEIFNGEIYPDISDTYNFELV